MARRVDPGSDGFYHFGASEWRDVVTGLAFLERAGFERVVIYAYSYGASVALEAQERMAEDPSLLGVTPGALVLDSPFLDPREVFHQGARNRGLPLPERVADLALGVAWLRAGIGWAELDQRRSAAIHTVPLLLIHGVEDQTIPVALSDAFARDYGGPVEFRRVKGVDHTEAWNSDPDAYEAWGRGFLAEYAPPSPVTSPMSRS